LLEPDVFRLQNYKSFMQYIFLHSAQQGQIVYYVQTPGFREAGSCDVKDVPSTIIRLPHVQIRHDIITSVIMYKLCGSHGSDTIHLVRHVLTLQRNVLTASALQPWRQRLSVYLHWCYHSTNTTWQYIPLQCDLNSVRLHFSSDRFLCTHPSINPSTKLNLLVYSLTSNTRQSAHLSQLPWVIPPLILSLVGKLLTYICLRFFWSYQ
jgi:hypothetical protein